MGEHRVQGGRENEASYSSKRKGGNEIDDEAT